VVFTLTAAVGGATVTPLAQPAKAPAHAQMSEPADLLDTAWGDDSTFEDEKASAASGVWQAALDLGSLYSITRLYGAQAAWSMLDAQGQRITGKGVDVAVIDTGIAPVAGLDQPGKVVNGPDLSFESQASNTRYLDGYGHGTHMAGIIAGRDSNVRAGVENDPQLFAGVAPDARIVNLKVAAADGGVDVSQVLAAIDWTVQHRQDNGMNIRVINLSYGTHARQPYVADPLAHAVENAWRKGIAVVVSAGNDGAAAPVTMPAADPYVISVGAVDHVGTAQSKDDTLTSFSNTGTSARRPDLVAPGKSVVSLRTPGSYADTTHPEGLVTGDESHRFFRGSGTSQATAVVSGAVALLLQQRPSLTPDQVKALLKMSADKLTADLSAGQGAGVVDIDGALATPTPAVTTARQTWTTSTGSGSLESARGESHVVDPANGAVLAGEVDALGTAWNAQAWSHASATGAAWSGGTWNGRNWSGNGWTQTSWAGPAWAATAWTGRSWSGLDWLARSWSGDTWTARSWSGTDFSARSWSGEVWRARTWSSYG
jgi:serine protease AprX